MHWRSSLWTIALCFGLGLGLAPTLRSAHACECPDPGIFWLELEQIEGDGELAVEESSWPATATISDDAGTTVLDLGSQQLGLERVP
jgi:hypothetical protein